MLCFQCGGSVAPGDRECGNCGVALKTTSKLKLSNSRGLRISQELKAIRLDQQLFPPGERVSDRFVLAEMIGRGPLGEVYRAQDEAIDADVAVKVFDKATIRNPRDEEVFVSAMRGFRTGSQENLVRIHDAGVHKEHAWVSMQYLEGLTLRKILELRKTKGERFDLDEIERVVVQVTEACQHLARKVAHGDLKPENIIFLPDLLKVTDGFVSSAFDPEAIMGRLKESPYLAPEVHDGKKPDIRSDVYSLGVVVGEMLFGSDYQPGSQASGSYGAFDTMIKRATAFDPNERYESLELFSEAFSTLVDTRGQRKGTPTPPPMKITPKSPPPAPEGDASEVSDAIDSIETVLVSDSIEYDISEDSDIIDIGDPESEVEIIEDKATMEYNRDLDLSDLMITKEAVRDTDKKVEEPTPKRKPQVTKTAAVPVPTGRPKSEDDSTNWMPIVAALIMGGLLVGGWLMLRPGEKEVVDLSSKNEKTTKVDDAKTKVDPMKIDPTKEIAVDAVVGEAKGVQEKAVATASLTTTETKPVDPTKTDDTKTDANDPKTDALKTDDTKTTPTDVVGIAKTDDSKTDKKPEEKIEVTPGTECPKGSILVKRKWGNFCIDRYEYPGGGVKPRTRVSWFDAKKQCAAKGKRLCKLKEWRSACGSKYPYGKTFDANKCNTTDEDGFERSIAKTGSFKSCRSRASGARDMVGNVHEWVNEQKIAGGGFESDESVGSCRYASSKSPGSSASYIGFRCCADPE